MKKLRVFLFLAITTNLSFLQAQDCPELPDTVYNCGFNVQIDIGFVEFFYEYDCDQGPGVITLDTPFPILDFTFSECGIYKVYITPIECPIDSIIFYIDDPDVSAFDLVSSSIFEYPFVLCVESGDACTNIVSVPGGIPPEPEWATCDLLNCTYTDYFTIADPPNPVDCVAGFINILENSGSGQNGACWVGDEMSFVNIDSNTGDIDIDFFDFLDSLNSETFGQATCPISSPCLPYDSAACIDSITTDSIPYEFPIHQGGRWTMLENGNTIIMDFQTPFTRNGKDFILVIEPGPTYYGPDSLKFTLLELIGTDTFPAYYDEIVTLFWEELFTYETIYKVDTIIHYSDSPECQGCGGTSIFSSFNIPPAPEYPCGPITITFGNPCNCLNQQLEITGNENIDCINNCTTLTGIYTDSEASQFSAAIWTDPSGNAIGNGLTIDACSPGTYILTVISADFSCPITSSFDVISNDNFPNPTILNYQIDCFTDCVVVTTGLEGNPNYLIEYTFPDGTMSNIGGPVCEAGEVSIYIVDLNSGCDGIFTSIISKITEPINLFVAHPNEIDCINPCTDLFALVTVDESLVNFFWTGPNGFVSTSSNVNVCEPGFYSITVDYGNCFDAFSVEVIELTQNIEIITFDTICIGDCVDFMGMTICDPGQYMEFGLCDSTFILFLEGKIGGQESKFYDLCDGEQIEVDGVVYDNAIKTSYTVMGPNGCDNLVDLEVTIFYLDLSIDGIEDLSCDNKTVNLSVSSSNVSNAFSWYDSSLNLIAIGSQITVDQAGIYFVKNLSNLQNCESSLSIEIKDFSAEPIITAPTNYVIYCEGEVTLEAVIDGIGMLDFIWTGPGIDGTNQYELNPIVSLPGMYKLVVGNEYGCTAEVEIEVSIIEILEFEVESDKSCSNMNDGMIEINLIQGGTPPFKFSLDNGEWQENSVFMGLSPKEYLVGILESDGCTHFEQIEVRGVAPVDPEINAFNVYDLCEEAEIIFDLSSQLDNQSDWKIEWNDNFKGTYRIIDQEGIYVLKISNECEEKRYEFDVADTRLNEDELLYIPNVFSPNEDGLNDKFICSTPYNLSKFKLSIYDRWGNLVFLSEDLTYSWDGIDIDRQGQQAVYAYIAEYEIINCKGDSKRKIRFGDVTVVR